MKFEDLQKEWQSMETEDRRYSHRELLDMMYNPGERYCRSASWREIGQFFLSVSVVLLSPFFDLFSLHTPPVGVALDEIDDEHLGTRYMRSMPYDDRPVPPLSASLAMMKVVLVVARLVHACLWAAVVLILIAPMGLEHGITVAVGIVLIPIILLATWWRARRRFRNVKTVDEVMKELEKIQSGISPQRP